MSIDIRELERLDGNLMTVEELDKLRAKDVEYWKAVHNRLHLSSYLILHLPDILSALRDKERLDWCDEQSKKYSGWDITRAQIDELMEDDHA